MASMGRSAYWSGPRKSIVSRRLEAEPRSVDAGRRASLRAHATTVSTDARFAAASCARSSVVRDAASSPLGEDDRHPVLGAAAVATAEQRREADHLAVGEGDRLSCRARFAGCRAGRAATRGRSRPARPGSRRSRGRWPWRPRTCPAAGRAGRRAAPARLPRAGPARSRRSRPARARTWPAPGSTNPRRSRNAIEYSSWARDSHSSPSLPSRRARSDRSRRSAAPMPRAAMARRHGHLDVRDGWTSSEVGSPASIPVPTTSSCS